MTLKPAIGLHAAMLDPNLFGKVFSGPSFWTWRVLARLIDGLPLVEQRERDLFFECTGRSKLPTGPVRRLYLLAGRRAGKDRFTSAAAIWRACLYTDWRKYTSAGEGAAVLLLGGDKKQANILSRYCVGLLAAPMILAEVVRDVQETIEFKNGASLEIATNDSRLVRGRSAIAVLGSEVSFWKTSEYAYSSDEEVLSSAEPSMAMCGDGGLMIMGSSVYRKRGLMYRKYRELFGNDDAEDICWFAPSPVMNPKLPASVIERALADNTPRAEAEYLNRWRSDLTDWCPGDLLENATDYGIFERPPRPHTTYFAHADAAGGTGEDSFGFAISHRDTSYVVDCIREYRPRFIPAQIIAELAVLMKAYGIKTIRGDRFAGGFHSSEWKAHGIEFVACDGTTSENYLACLPLLLAGRVRLPDNKTLRQQLGSLERRPGDGARETVAHPQHSGAHDDVATAVCGAIVAAMPVMGGAVDLSIWRRACGDDGVAEAKYEIERRLRYEEEQRAVEANRGVPPRNVFPRGIIVP